MLVAVVFVIVLAAITVIVRSGRQRSRLNEKRAMRDYIRRISHDGNADN